jgi:TRAP-type C4-dicarboxylate transport system permease small subunit
MRYFFKTAQGLAKKMYWIAGAAIIAMMLLTCADVILRYFRRPIPGTYELVCFFGAVSIAFAMAHTSVEKGHVAVSLVVRYFPRRIQGLVDAITTCLSLILFALIAWHSILYAGDLRSTGEVSLTLELPFYPFVYGVGFSAAAVCLVLLTDLIDSLEKVFGQ